MATKLARERPIRDAKRLQQEKAAQEDLAKLQRQRQKEKREKEWDAGAPLRAKEAAAEAVAERVARSRLGDIKARLRPEIMGASFAWPG